MGSAGIAVYPARMQDSSRLDAENKMTGKRPKSSPSAPKFAGDHALVRTMIDLAALCHENPIGRVGRMWHADGKAFATEPLTSNDEDEHDASGEMDE